MKTLFEIIPDTFNSENCILCCELSAESFSYAISADDEKKVISLGVYQFEKTRPQTGFPIALQILFHQHRVLGNKFKRSCIIYSVERSVLIPFSLYNSQKNEEVLNLVYGDFTEAQTIFKDVIPGHDLYNTYSVSTILHNTVLQQFPTIRGIHQYTGYLKKEIPDTDKLTIVFYQEKIVLSLFKEGKFQLINSYSYRTPEDVAYILLNVCKQYNAENIVLEVIGLIEENSALYKCIFNYFSNVRFAEVASEYTVDDAISEYPLHFFKHLYEFELCE